MTGAKWGGYGRCVHCDGRIELRRTEDGAVRWVHVDYEDVPPSHAAEAPADESPDTEHRGR